MYRQIIFLSSALWLMGCSSKPPAAGPQAGAAGPPPDVKVIETRSVDVPIMGEWVGTLDGMINAKIKAQVSGYLLRQNYKEGERVREGQPLFEIDPRPFEAALAQAQGQLSQAQGQVAQARGQKAQALALQSQASSQMLQARALLEQAQGQLQQAEAATVQAQVNQRKAQLDEDRYRPLAGEKAVTLQELDNAVQANLAAQAQVRVVQAQVQSAKGTVSSAKAQVETARSAITAAQAQVQSAEAALQTAQAQVESAQAQVQVAQLNLSFTQIVSPISGIVGIANAQVGDLVGPNSEILATVSQVDPIKVNFNVPEQEYLESAKRRGPFQGGLSHPKTRYQLVRADGSEYLRPGRFHAEDRNVALNTGAIRFTVLFPNPESVLRPGQYGRVKAVRYTEKQVIVVPQRAVSELQDRHQVVVVGAGNKIEFRPVEVGTRLGSDWIIKSGLKSGESVIVEGLQKARPGSLVNPLPYVASEPKS